MFDTRTACLESYQTACKKCRYIGRMSTPTGASAIRLIDTRCPPDPILFPVQFHKTSSKTCCECQNLPDYLPRPLHPSHLRQTAAVMERWCMSNVNEYLPIVLLSDHGIQACPVASGFPSKYNNPTMGRKNPRMAESGMRVKAARGRRTREALGIPKCARAFSRVLTTRGPLFLCAMAIESVSLI